MINIYLAFISILAWLIMYFLKPYYYASSKAWEIFWVIVFCTIGGCCGIFICQSIIFLIGGNTIL